MDQTNKVYNFTIQGQLIDTNLQNAFIRIQRAIQTNDNIWFRDVQLSEYKEVCNQINPSDETLVKQIFHTDQQQ